MSLKDQCSVKIKPDDALKSARGPAVITVGLESRHSHRFRKFVFFLAALSVLFFRPLLDLFYLAAGSELLSYIVLIPLASAYLIFIRREQLPARSQPSIAVAVPLFLIGLAVLAFAFGHPTFSLAIKSSTHLALTILAFVSFVAAGGFLFLGREWMHKLAFAFAFLIFLVPLPQQMIDWLETASQIASADAADMFFTLSGTPILREGMVFQLPGMVIQVAQECSGIRSSLVLFITSLLAAYMFLESPWRRFVLVALVIPLGILRNGFRILVIGLLCVHYGPEMINSAIHRRGGPVFFVLSLLPLFLLLWWLRRGDSSKRRREPMTASPARRLDESFPSD